MKHSTNLILRLIIFFTLCIPLFQTPAIHAQSSINLECAFFNSDVYKNSDGGSCGPNDLGSIYNPIVRTIFTIGGLITFTGLLYGGFLYIMGAGGDTNKLQQAQQTITWSLIGLAVLFSVYWIIQIVEILTDTNILSPSL